MYVGPTALSALSDTVSGQLREMCGYTDDVTFDASEVSQLSMYMYTCVLQEITRVT